MKSRRINIWRCIEKNGTVYFKATEKVSGKHIFIKGTCFAVNRKNLDGSFLSNEAQAKEACKQSLKKESAKCSFNFISQETDKIIETIKL